MQIKQKKAAYKLTFTFNDEYVNYAYDHRDGSGDYDIKYIDFPSKFITFIERNDYCRNVGLIWIFLGFAYHAFTFYKFSHPSLWGFLGIFLGILCLIFVSFRKIKFTIYETQYVGMLIIQNSKHDEIINEIMSRRKEKLLKLYGDINPDNDIENEIEKFEWLEREKVLSKKEATEKIVEIKNRNKNKIGFM